MPLSLSSTAFTHEGPIPMRYTCDAEDVSPELSWTGVPEGTASLALIVDDPDAPDPEAPKMTWVHWVLCNLPPGQSLARVVAGQQTLSQAMVEAPGGFRLIRGASGLARIAALGEFERARLMRQIQALEQDVDLVLIDTGAGVSPNVLGFSMGADQLLVVTTPEPTAVTDAYAVIKTTRAHRQDLGVQVLVNMVRHVAEGREVFHRLDAVCRRFLDLNLRYAGHVVWDSHVGAAVRRRRPFMLTTPRCPAGVCIDQLAHRMDRHAVASKRQGWFQRAAGWLTE